MEKITEKQRNKKTLKLTSKIKTPNYTDMIRLYGAVAVANMLNNL